MYFSFSCTYLVSSSPSEILQGTKTFENQHFSFEIILGITLYYSLSSMYGISDSENGWSGISFLWESDRGEGISGSEYRCSSSSNGLSVSEDQHLIQP